MRARNHAFDILCGICILRMVTLHAICQTALRQTPWWRATMTWTFFFMCFFFFKAGYFNKGVHGTTSTYCLDKFKRLMVPYFVWGAISLGIVVAFVTLFPQPLHQAAEGLHRFRWWVGGLTVGNGPLWFLPCFFGAYVVAHLMEKVRRLHWLIVLFPIISWWLAQHGNPLWFMLNNVFCGVFFFALGKAWHHVLDRLGRWPSLWLSAGLTAAFVCTNVWMHGEYEMRPNEWVGPFGHVMLNTVLALLGLSGVLLSAHVRRVPGLCYVGEHSMVYFVSHYPLILCYTNTCLILGHSIKRSVPDLVMMLALTFAIATLLVPLVERVPWLSGRFHTSRGPMRRVEEADAPRGQSPDTTSPEPAPHVVRPTLYFYHTQDTVRIVREWRQGLFPSHFLYGAIELESEGYPIVWHDQIHRYRRVQDTVRATWKVLTCRRPYDILYATHTRGIEPIILLHALGLYRRHIVVWHHQPIVRAGNIAREALARLFYRGIDHMFFFSHKLIDDSLRSAKADIKRMSVAHWGADLDFYDHHLRPDGQSPTPFLSSGKELRDYATLLDAFRSTGVPLTVFAQAHMQPHFAALHPAHNITIHYANRLMPYEIALHVAQTRCVCICCKRSNYTVGLTTVVEAMALGLPILCTRNPQMPMDLEREGCGICIDVGDQAGWERAIRFIATHPDEARLMGQRGRQLAETLYNAKRCAQEVGAVIMQQKYNN